MVAVDDGQVADRATWPRCSAGSSRSTSRPGRRARSATSCSTVARRRGCPHGVSRLAVTPRGARDHRARRRSGSVRRRTPTRTATPAATRWATSPARSAGSRCRTSTRWVWGAARRSPGVAAVASPRRRRIGVCEPASAGQGQHDRSLGDLRADRSTGRSRPIPTGFPADGHRRVRPAHRARRAGQQGGLGHARSWTSSARSTSAPGSWIVYTSADSVFQVAAHEETVPLGGAVRRLRGRAGAAAGRARRLAGDRAAVHAARRGAWVRTAGRKDFSLPPPGADAARPAGRAARPARRRRQGGRPVRGPGHLQHPHRDQRRGLRPHRGGAASPCDRGLLLANVIEFDQTWGHRNDVPGFHARPASSSTARCPACSPPVREEDLIIFTADHGNDPTTPSTDHSREVVPLLVTGPRVRPVALGRRSHVRRYRPDGGRVPRACRRSSAGTSFLSEVWRD